MESRETLQEILDRGVRALCGVINEAYKPGVIASRGIDAAQGSVLIFHEQHGISVQTYLPSLPCDKDASDLLEHAASDMSALADELLSYSKTDVRALRAHLIVEEAAEVLAALHARDEVALLDGLTDLQYVNLGTAATFDLPSGDAFVEVHQSNMTKQKSPKDPNGQRLRDKGPNYRPPNLAEVLLSYRKHRVSPHTWNESKHECEFCGMSYLQILKQMRKYGKKNCKGHSV